MTKRKPTVVASNAKNTVTKGNETVTATKATPATEVKEEVKAPVVEKKAVKTPKAEAKPEIKPVAKKAAGKEVKPEIFVQFNAKEAVVADICAKAKAQFVAEGHEEKEIKTLQIYIKPEDNAAYYVINENNAGKVTLF